MEQCGWALDKILVSRKFCEVMGDIERIRTKTREEKGSIMDTYLCRSRGR
jgi:hypothetical protein